MRLREYLEVQKQNQKPLKEDFDDDFDDDLQYYELEDVIDFDLESIGFIRNENEDDYYYRLAAYSVDGADRVLVSVCAPDPDYPEDNYNIYATISGSLKAEDDAKLPHKDAVANPHVGKIPADQMTPQDWEAFYNDCLAYQKEYEEAEQQHQNALPEAVKENGTKELKESAASNVDKYFKLIDDRINEVASIALDDYGRTEGDIMPSEAARIEELERDLAQAIDDWASDRNL